MTAYIVEMAFDWNSANETGETTGMLQQQLYDGEAACSYANLKSGDTMLFPLYDNSLSPPGLATVTACEISIVAAEGDPPYPLSPTPTFAGSVVMTAGGTSATYPSVNANAWPVGATPFTITIPDGTEARYLVTYTVTVKMPSGESRTFTDDPEWMVGGGP